MLFKETIGDYSDNHETYVHSVGKMRYFQW
jgi:hypothetical protein